MCEHSAVLYRGDKDLSRRLGSSLQRAAAEGAAVLLRLDGAAEARVRTDFGSMCERAVCLYDATRTPAHLRHDVGRTHESLIGDWTLRAGDDPPVDFVVPFPTRRSNLILRDPTPAFARTTLKGLLGSCVSQALMTDLQIVASELVTNAVVHGAAPAVLEVWHEADGCTLRVTDSGPRGVERYAHFRPLQGGPHGGFGLFTVGQLADSVEFIRQDDTTVVSVYMASR